MPVTNTLITPDIVARESLIHLQNNTILSRLVSSGYGANYTGSKVGETITVKIPPVVEAQEFSGTVTPQNLTQGFVTLELEKLFTVDYEISSSEFTLSLDDFSNTVVKPSMIALNQKLDAYLASLYKQVPYFSGTAGDPPDSVVDVLQVDKVLNVNKCPIDPRYLVVDPSGKVDLMSTTGLVDASAIGDGGQTFRSGQLGRVLGFNAYMNQNVKTHTAGTLAAGSPLVDGAVLAGATTMDIDGGVGVETIKLGDIFTVDGVTGQFVFTADKTAVAGAITGATFYPAAPVGGFANNAPITIVEDHTANLAFHPQAIALAVVPLEKPMGSATSSVLSDGGLSVRVVFDYDSSTKKDKISFDILCGAVVVRPELACRVLG